MPLVKFKSSKINPDRTNTLHSCTVWGCLNCSTPRQSSPPPRMQSGNVYILDGLWYLRRKVIIALYLNSHIHLPWNFFTMRIPSILGVRTKKYLRNAGSSEISSASVTHNLHAKNAKKIHILRSICFFFQTFYNQFWGLF